MRHYQTISVVLGAGASREIGVPTAHEMVKAFDKLMTSPDRQITHEDRDLYFRVKETLTSEELSDFEVIFDRLSLDPEDARVAAPPEAKKRLFRILREHFGKLLLLGDMGTDNHYCMLDVLAVHLSYALHVYTTNQDTGVEQGAAPNRFADGFWGRGRDRLWNISPFPIKGTKPVVCLHKLHGSVNWQRTPTGEFFSTDPSQEVDVTKAVLVLGHKAKVPSRLPYTFEHQADLFRRVSVDLIAVIGSSLRDPHANDLLLGALRRGADILVVAPEPPSGLEAFREQAREPVPGADPNITPGRILLLRQTAKEFFMGLPESLWLGIPIDGGNA